MIPAWGAVRPRNKVPVGVFSFFRISFSSCISVCLMLPNKQFKNIGLSECFKSQHNVTLLKYRYFGLFVVLLFFLTWILQLKIFTLVGGHVTLRHKCGLVSSKCGWRRDVSLWTSTTTNRAQPTAQATDWKYWNTSELCKFAKTEWTFL